MKEKMDECLFGACGERKMLWECVGGGCVQTEETTGTEKKIIISNSKTGKEVEFSPEEFASLKEAIKKGEL